MITSINNFPSISSLQTLSITSNSINDLSSFITSAKIKYPQLQSLNTLSNPMNPGRGNPSAYNQYKSFMKQIGKITELDGININDTSYMNQQQRPKRDLFGTSSGAQPKRDLFGTTSNTTKVNFFDSTPTSTTSSNNATNPAMNNNSVQSNPTKTKMGLFDNMGTSQQTPKQSTNMSNMFGNTGASNSRPAVSMNSSSTGGQSSGLVFKRQFFVIDESAEIDGTEFVNSKKKKSVIMVNEKILKKSDNMTKFNRKNKSEGNKHILNSDL